MLALHPRLLFLTAPSLPKGDSSAVARPGGVAFPSTKISVSLRGSLSARATWKGEKGGAPQQRRIPRVPRRGQAPQGRVSKLPKTSESELRKYSRMVAKEKVPVPQRQDWRTLVGMLFLLGFTHAVDKAIMSIALMPMSKQFGWAETDKGYIGSAFFWGFMLSQISGGMLAQRFGSRAVLTAVMCWWSLLSLVTPIAAATSLPALLAVRISLGLGEGICVPICTTLLAENVPAESRSKALAVAFSGGTMGTIIALLVCPSLLNWAPWPLLFRSVGCLGLAWLLGWRFFGPRPRNSQGTLDAEVVINPPARLSRTTSGSGGNTAQTGLRKRQVQGGSSQVSDNGGVVEEESKEGKALAKGIPWGGFARCKGLWAIAGAHFCSSWGFYTALSWLPTFFSQRLKLGLGEASRLTLIPWAVSFLAGNTAGWLADRLATAGMHKTHVRKFMQGVAFLGPALCLLMLANVQTPAMAVALLSGVLGLGTFANGGFCSNHADISPKYAGLLFAITSTVGCVGGSTSVTLTGQILQRYKDWGYVWVSTAGIYVLGMLWYATLASTELEFA